MVLAGVQPQAAPHLLDLNGPLHKKCLFYLYITEKNIGRKANKKT